MIAVVLLLLPAAGFVWLWVDAERKRADAFAYLAERREELRERIRRSERPRGT